LARSAEREIPLSAFLFDRFFFAPPSCKEKSAMECREQYGTRLCGDAIMRGTFAKVPLHPQNLSERFLLCDGVRVGSGLRCCQLPSGTAKTLPALAKQREPPSEKFWSSFFKSLRGQGRVALGALRRARNSPDRRFFLIDFSLRLLPAKKNRLWSAESNMRAVYAGGHVFRQKTS